MSDEDSNPRARRVLKWFGVLLALFGVSMAVFGQFAVAGVTFLGLTFVIYLWETM